MLKAIDNQPIEHMPSIQIQSVGIKRAFSHNILMKPKNKNKIGGFATGLSE